MFKKPILYIGIFFVFAGCASSLMSKDGQGRWSERDSFLLSKEIVKDCLSADWREEFVSFRRRRPAVAIGGINSLTREIVEDQSLKEFLEEDLHSSKEVLVIDLYNHLFSQDPEDALERSERIQRKIFETAMARGVDYLLMLTVSSRVDAVRDINVLVFQIETKVFSVKTEQMVWVGIEFLKKRIIVHK